MRKPALRCPWAIFRSENVDSLFEPDHESRLGSFICPYIYEKLVFSDQMSLPQLKFIGIILVPVSAPRNLKLNNSIVARLSPGLTHHNFSRAAFLLLSVI